jgi:2-dehydropantoate 2-reductase
MKITVLGAGSMGSLFGGYLSASNDVCLLDVWKEHMDAVNRSGLKIQKGDETLLFHPKGYTKAEEIGLSDLVIVFVKSTQTAAAVAANMALFGPDTLAVSLQNGLGNEEGLLTCLDPHNIIMGTTQMTAGTIEPGWVKNNGGLRTYVGPLTDNVEGTERIAAAFREAGFDTGVCTAEGVQRMIWDKLLVNASGNPLNALLQAPNTIFQTNESARAILESVARENVRIANACGFDFSADTLMTRLDALFTSAPNHKSSMMQDREHKRKTEIDMINGAIVRKAHSLGLAAPNNEMIVNLIHVMEATY